MQVSQRTSCIWIYLWLLDKITKIDPVTGMGIVLGGKPIKVEDLALFGDRKTVMKILARLESEGYIKTTRTPYGKVIRVTKAKKSFGWKVERYPTSGTPEVPESVHLRATRGTSNKTIQLDSNKDIPAKRGTPTKKRLILIQEKKYRNPRVPARMCTGNYSGGVRNAEDHHSSKQALKNNLKPSLWRKLRKLCQTDYKNGGRSLRRISFG